MHSGLEVLHGNLSNIDGIGGCTQGFFYVLVFSLITAFDFFFIRGVSECFFFTLIGLQSLDLTR